MDLERVPKFGGLLGVLIRQVLKIRRRHSPHWRWLCLGCSVGMAFLQQFEQPALQDVTVHFPRPERRRVSVACDLSDGESPGTVAFDRDHLNAFTASRIIARTQARGFAHPNFAGEYVSVHPPPSKAIPQRRACGSPCAMIRPIRRNVKTLTVGHTLKSRMDLSGALELGADAAQCIVQVLVERGGLQLRQPFPRSRCRLSALVTVRYGFAPWSCCG